MAIEKSLIPTQNTHPILIVDDERLVLLALEKTLQSAGYPVLTALDGRQAIEIMQLQPISVIICDLMLPEMSGTEVLIQSQILQPDAIRIALTGYSDLSTVISSINRGHISQFLTKPWEDFTLRQMVGTSLEKYRLVKENQHLQNLLYAQHNALSTLHEGLKKELQLGARIHETLLTGTIPEGIQALDIFVMAIPSTEIDGDFFEFFHPLHEILDVAIGDVMGKGIPAALVGTAIKAQMVRYSLPLKRHQSVEGRQGWEEDLLSPHEIVHHTHVGLIDKLLQLEYFSSLFYGRFNLKKKTFHYVDCGSPKPIHYKNAEKRSVLLSGGNFPLGMVKEDKFYSNKTEYQVHDLFVFYSDGITETASPSGELFGVERLIKLVEENCAENPKRLTELIKSQVGDFAKKEVFHDDLTLIVVHIADKEQPTNTPPIFSKFMANLSQLEAVRDLTTRFCSKGAGNVELLSSHLQLAINEIFCNIVIHGYCGDSRGIIRIYGEYLADGVLFEISDQGQAFDPDHFKEPSLAGDQDDGFGWYMIRKITDKITYEKKVSETGWNHLRIFKRYLWGENLMHFAQTTKDDVLIITPEAKSLDVKAAPEFKKSVIDIISHNEVQNVVFDLHELQFIDSSGLGSFLSVLRVLHTQGGELKLANMNKTIRTMFELVSMHKIFEIFNSTDEAIKSFK